MPVIEPLDNVTAPTVSLCVFISKVPPDTAIEPVSANTLSAPKAIVPALIVVPPVYVLLPDSVKVPEPCLIRLPSAPLITPLTAVFVASPTIKV